MRSGTNAMYFRIINVLKKIGDLKYNAYKDDQRWLSIFSKFIGALESGSEIERSCALRLKIFAVSPFIHSLVSYINSVYSQASLISVLLLRHFRSSILQREQNSTF